MSAVTGQETSATGKARSLEAGAGTVSRPIDGLNAGSTPAPTLPSVEGTSSHTESNYELTIGADSSVCMMRPNGWEIQFAQVKASTQVIDAWLRRARSINARVVDNRREAKTDDLVPVEGK
jgi:hypothetical protein